MNRLTSSTALAVELLDQHRGRRLADAAAVAVEIDLLERPVVVDLQFQADHVAAQRIVVLVRVRAARTPPAMVRLLVVLLDALLVEFFFVDGHSLAAAFIRRVRETHHVMRGLAVHFTHRVVLMAW